MESKIPHLYTYENGLPFASMLNFMNQYEALSLEIIKLQNKVHKNYTLWTAKVEGRLN